MPRGCDVDDDDEGDAGAMTTADGGALAAAGMEEAGVDADEDERARLSLDGGEIDLEDSALLAAQVELLVPGAGLEEAGGGGDE